VKPLTQVTLEDLTRLCISRGIVYPTARIYGGLAGFFDYGPIGAELRNEVLNDWWWYYVKRREDIVGIHGSIITHPKTWVASGHVESFVDYIVRCKKCQSEYRADHLLEDQGIKVVNPTLEELTKLLNENNIRCPKCKGELGNPEPFNLMFTTYVGPKKTKSSLAYLRPETAQLIFVNYRDIYISMRLKLPFGIAQIGKAFRNEISPRNFLFRAREFEQMEIEYFINPKKINDCPYWGDVKHIKINLLSAEKQEEGIQEHEEITAEEALQTDLIKSTWHAYWVVESLKWLWRIGLSKDKLRVREHVKTELAHYAVQTFDIEYYFPYMGWKEIEGISNRTDYDLRRHSEYSKVDMSMLDDGEKVIPHVIEPSFGLDRVILALLTEAYKIIDKRRVLSLSPRIAPIKIGVYPLLSREPFTTKAREVYNILKEHYTTIYDQKGSIGRRYARADEIGVPLGITIDGQTLEDNTVTIRFRDTRHQIRVPITKLLEEVSKYLKQPP